MRKRNDASVVIGQLILVRLANLRWNKNNSLKICEKLPVPEANTCKIQPSSSLNRRDRINLRVWCLKMGLVKIQVSEFATLNYHVSFDWNNSGQRFSA